MVTPSGMLTDPEQLELVVTELLITEKVPLVPHANVSCVKDLICLLYTSDAADE